MEFKNVKLNIYTEHGLQTKDNYDLKIVENNSHKDKILNFKSSQF